MKQRQRKRSLKARLKQCARGSISVLLCLLLSPFLSVTLGLIEYARYQQLIETSGELMDLLGISEIANYDTYIHQRFGLLAVSQETALGENAADLMVENAKTMGNQIVPNITTVSGVSGMTLKDTDILKKQLTDVSEFTSTAAVISEDLKLDELLAKLNGIQQFAGVMNTVDSLAEATEAVTTAVNAAKKLEEDIRSVQQKVSSVVEKSKSLAGKFSALFTKLGNEGITLPENPTSEEIALAVSQFQESYLNDIKELYTQAKEFQDVVNQLKSSVSGIKSDVTSLKNAISAAKTAIKNIGASNDADPDGSISQGTAKSLKDILGDMEGLITGTLTDIKDETISTVESALTGVLDTINESTGLVDVAEKYGRIVRGEYFRIDSETHIVSDEAKNDVIELLKMARRVYSSNSEAGDIESAIKDYFVGRFVPDLSSIDFSSMADQIQNVLSSAATSLQDSAEAKLGDMIDGLGNLATQIFSMTVFYNGRLNSTVTLGSSETGNANQDFIDAVRSLINAANDFKNSVGGLDILGMLGAMWDLLVSIKNMIVSIMEKIGLLIESIGEIVSGGGKSLYERFVISGYMRHNLPCRVDAGDVHGGKVDLSGKGITLFDYDKIARYGNNTFKGAELEYVYAGTDSEIANQTLLFWDLYFLRLLLDLPSVFRSDTVRSLAAAATVASWAVYLLYIIIEPFLDTLLLVNGVKVSLIRRDCWMTPKGIIEFGGKLTDAVTDCAQVKDMMNGFLNDMVGTAAEGGTVSGGDSSWDLSYQTYTLLLLALTVSTERQVTRLSNIIDMETKQYYADKGLSGKFQLGNTYVAVQIRSDFTFDPFFDLGIASEGASYTPGISLKHIVSY